MASLLKCICENSDSSYISTVLEIFADKHALHPGLDFLESLKLALWTLEDATNLSEDFVRKVLKDICLPVLYNNFSDEAITQQSGGTRQRLHLCCDLISFCCSLYPSSLLTEVCEKSLRTLERYSLEKSSMEENARDVSVTLDLIGYLQKSGVLNASGVEIEEKLFQELLHLLPHTNENLCSKMAGIVLPNFLESKGKERTEAVWNVIKHVFQYEVSSSDEQTFCQSYVILCGLADFFFGANAGSKKCHIFHHFEFWEIIQMGLVLTDALSRKRAMYLLKRALDLLDKQPQDLLVQHKMGHPIFHWRCQNRDSFMTLWQDYVLLMEALDEKQAHIIKPVLSRMSAIVAGTKEEATGAFMMDISWLLTLYQRAAQHDNKYICKWAILDLLGIDLCESPLLNTSYRWFLYGPLLNMLSEFAIYAKTDNDSKGDAPAVGVAAIRFFVEFAKRLTVVDRKSFCMGLLEAVVKQNFTQVPLLFISQMLASLPRCAGWNSNSLASVRAIFPILKTFDTHLCSAIQSFLLKAVINLTDSWHVEWNDIASFLSLLSSEDCLCRGSVLWEATIDWVWQIQNNVGQEFISEKSGSELQQQDVKNLFDFLTASVDAFLNDETSDLTRSDLETQSFVRMMLIGCDACLKFTAGAETRRQVENIIQKIVCVVQHAATHVYASENRTQKAVVLLAGILEHVNATRIQLKKEFVASPCTGGKRHLDDCLKIIDSVLRICCPEVLMLLTRKLTVASTSCFQVNFRCAFLDLARELYSFVMVSVKTSEGLEVYYRFVEDVIAKSRKIILEKQAARIQLSLSEWCSLVVSAKCLAWCCTAVRTKRDLYSSRLVHDLLRTVAELNLSSEFSKPQLVHPAGDDVSPNTSALVKKNWGRIVSDFLEAQWLCVEFLLEESQWDADDQDRMMWDKVEPFLEALPEAALEVLSLGSGRAVLPIIRCMRLLTPRMLLSDHALCSHAMEAVWWTFQDCHKGDHIWFWATLKETTRVFFNPCLLVLSKDHPATSTVRRFWSELLALGEDRPGVLNHVIAPCCQFWTNCRDDALIAHPRYQSCSFLNISEEARRKSLEVHVELVTEACIFGPRQKKTTRVTNYAVDYVRHLSEQGTICRLVIDDLRDDTRVRVNALNTLLTLDPISHRDERILQRVTRAIIFKARELSEHKPRSSINSFAHRRKHRAWQAVLVILSRLQNTDPEGFLAREVLEGIFCAVLNDNQVSVRYLLEWAMFIILGRYPSLRPLLWQKLKYDAHRRSGCVSSFITVSALLGEYSFPDRQSQAAYIRQALPAVLPWVLTSHVVGQVYAQVALQKLWMVCQRQNLNDVILEHHIIKSCFEFLEINNEGIRQKTRILGNFFFFDLHPYRDFTIETLFDTLPRLAEVTDEEWISPKIFEHGSLGMRVWSLNASESGCLPLYNPKGTRLAQNPGTPYFNYEESMGEQITRRLEGKIPGPRDNEQTVVQPTGEASGLSSGDVQKKMTPWKVIPPEDEMLLELQHQRMTNLQKSSAGKLIVVAALIDKAPNLGGLCRTCEIFGVQSLVLSNTHVIEDVQFKSLSVSAAKWMSIQEVRVSELKPYLERMRHQGYTLIGVEQTANSQTLTRYQFPVKSLLLLGNEKEGIPVELIQMLDVCVEIPQVGVIRSLNVHVSGALLVWEYTRQMVLGANSHDC